MRLEKLLWLGLTILAAGATAQMATDPVGKASEVPAPPAFNRERVIPIEMPKYVSLSFGVDPATLSITPDGIVRYVMVATSATGTISAMYEGIRCATGEVKTYARYNAQGPWSPVENPQWQDLNSNLPSRHALALARQGACVGSMPASSTKSIVNSLKNQTVGPAR